MKELSELEFYDDVAYFEEHTWVRKDGELVEIGISDYAQDQLGEIIFIELPELDTTFEKGDEFGVVESVKAASELYMPVGGVVVAVNVELEDDPGKVNNQPFTKGWMIRIKVSDANELKALMDVDAYRKTLTD
jgi:glycine cleavage system H protein